MTHTDPTADAFMRRILARPADPVPRLVFADWLEESGTSSNLAWARYLRLADELATAPADDRRRPKLARDLERVGACIRAKLTYRAELLVAYPEAMLQVLPARNMVLNPETVTVPISVVELVPESVARENECLPLARLEDGGIVFGTTRPDDRWLANRLGFILHDRPIVLVDVVEPGLDAVLDRHYGLMNTESVDSPHYLWLPTDGVRFPEDRSADPIARMVDVLVLDAVVHVATALELAPEADRVNAWYWTGGLRRQVEAPPARYYGPIAAAIRSAAGIADPAGDGELVLTYWGRPRRLPVRVTETPHGPHVHVTIPPETAEYPAALNPAA
jgi:uncharacterized protein (TIGR02996 family)